jgi:hypothetical protein
MQNMRAFARCLLATAVTLCASAASAGTVNLTFGSTTIDFVSIGNPGNAGKVITGGTFGAVSNPFNMGRSEVSNAEYVTFLNAVAASDPYELYNTAMTSSPTGGINRSGASGSFTYSLKSPSSGSMPANWIGLYDSARFVNWLNNGAPTSVAPGSVDSVINTGAYTLANVLNPATALVRNVGATVFLPTRDEWFKAAYYSQGLNGGSGGYYTYPTASNSLPSISTDPNAVGTNLGYYGQSNSALPMVVDGLANSQSDYGVIGMLGNMWERLETSTSTQSYWNGGWVNMPAGSVGSSSSSNFAGSLTANTNENGFGGFRVAAVPEPSTIMLAILGLVTVGGGEVARRRKARLASALAA